MCLLIVEVLLLPSKWIQSFPFARVLSYLLAEKTAPTGAGS
jgi:hypothetical protein